MRRVLIHRNSSDLADPGDLEKVFRFRCPMFKGRLYLRGSDSGSLDRRDRFDEPEPIYLIHRSDAAAISTIPLLRNSRPNLLRDAVDRALGQTQQSHGTQMSVGSLAVIAPLLDGIRAVVSLSRRMLPSRADSLAIRDDAHLHNDLMKNTPSRPAFGRNADWYVA